MHHHTRRTFLNSAAALFAWSFLPKQAIAAGKDPRLLVVVLRGGLDGLSTIAPVKDPDYADLHGKIALSLEGEKPALALDGFFAANPALVNFHALYGEKQALVVHGVHTSYRERSHFDGQDVLESGLERMGSNDSGWLNRVFAALERTERVKAPLGVGPQVPLIVRGNAPITAWQPQILPLVSEDTHNRLLQIYEASDAQLANALRQSRRNETMLRNRPNYVFESLTGAARILAEPNGPRLGAITIDGFDTHAGATVQLRNRLLLLDSALPKMKELLGDSWKDTVVLFVTEFGRTAKINGTEGTDHGMATTALMVGGAVKGGRVIADWAGLKPQNLYQGRDLKPTLDLRSVIKGILADHLGLDLRKNGEKIFPGSLAVKPMDGLV